MNYQVYWEYSVVGRYRWRVSIGCKLIKSQITSFRFFFANKTKALGLGCFFSQFKWIVSICNTHLFLNDIVKLRVWRVLTRPRSWTSKWRPICYNWCSCPEWVDYRDSPVPHRLLLNGPRERNDHFQRIVQKETPHDRPHVQALPARVIEHRHRQMKQRNENRRIKLTSTHCRIQWKYHWLWPMVPKCPMALRTGNSRVYWIQIRRSRWHYHLSRNLRVNLSNFRLITKH